MFSSWSSPVPRLLCRLALAVVLLGVVAGCEQPPPEPRTRQNFHLREFKKDFGYAQAVKVDRTLYISGTVAVDAEGRLIAPGDMAGQLEAAYRNLGATLSAHGATFEHVVRENIYTTDMEKLLKVADLRFNYYPKDTLPAGTWMEVRRLVDPGFLVEIEVTAELP